MAAWDDRKTWRSREAADRREAVESTPLNRRAVRCMCATCDGTGRSPWRDGQTCDRCDGYGTILTYVELS